MIIIALLVACSLAPLRGETPLLDALKDYASEALSHDSGTQCFATKNHLLLQDLHEKIIETTNESPDYFDCVDSLNSVVDRFKPSPLTVELIDGKSTAIHEGLDICASKINKEQQSAPQEQQSAPQEQKLESTPLYTNQQPLQHQILPHVFEKITHYAQLSSMKLWNGIKNISHSMFTRSCLDINILKEAQERPDYSSCAQFIDKTKKSVYPIRNSHDIECAQTISLLGNGICLNKFDIEKVAEPIIASSIATHDYASCVGAIKETIPFVIPSNPTPEMLQQRDAAFAQGFEVCVSKINHEPFSNIDEKNINHSFLSELSDESSMLTPSVLQENLNKYYAYDSSNVCPHVEHEKFMQIFTDTILQGASTSPHYIDCIERIDTIKNLWFSEVDPAEYHPMISDTIMQGLEICQTKPDSQSLANNDIITLLNNRHHTLYIPSTLHDINTVTLPLTGLLCLLLVSKPAVAGISSGISSIQRIISRILTGNNQPHQENPQEVLVNDEIDNENAADLQA